MKVLILAAGMGTRIKEYSRGKPKCLLKINGKTILSHQIDSLEKAGIKRKNIIIVNGYKASYIEDMYPNDIKYITNKNYSSTNSIYSMWLARNENYRNGMILLNADVIFHSKVISKLINTNGNALAVDFNKILIEGEMNVIVNDKNEIKEISKKINAKNANGESVQIIKLEKHSVDILFEECNKIIKEGLHDKFPAYIFKHIIDQRNINAVDIQNLPWYEIDNYEDFENAKKIKLN